MPRKSVTDLKSADKLIDEAIENFKSVSEIKYELAKDAYDMQDDKTKAVIDRLVKTLQTYATGSITLQLAPPHGKLVAVAIENDYLMFNLLYLAMEIVKDLAITGIRVAKFEFPPSLCSNCGSEIIPELRTKKGKVKQ